MNVLCASRAHEGPQGQHARGEAQHPRRATTGQRADRDRAVGPAQRRADRRPDPERHEQRVEDDPPGPRRRRGGSPRPGAAPDRSPGWLGQVPARPPPAGLPQRWRTREGRAGPWVEENPNRARPSGRFARTPGALVQRRVVRSGERRRFRPADAARSLGSPAVAHHGARGADRDVRVGGPADRLGPCRVRAGGGVLPRDARSPRGSGRRTPRRWPTGSRVHLWDLPGYGRSSKRPGPPGRTPASTPRRCHGPARPLGPRPAAGRGARPRRPRRPCGRTWSRARRYASLFLVDVVADPAERLAVLPVRPGQPRRCSAQLPAYVHEAIVRAYVGNATPPRPGSRACLDALVEPWTGAEGQPAFYRQIADYDLALLRRERATALPELDLPVRVLWGTEDTWIPLETGRRFAALVPGAVLTEVPEAGPPGAVRRPGRAGDRPARLAPT